MRVGLFCVHIMPDGGSGEEGTDGLPDDIAEKVAEELGVDNISEVTNEVKVVYNESEDYSSFPVNFANVGSLSQGGGYKLDLFFEYLSLPEGQTRLHISDENRSGFGPELNPGRQHVVREQKASAILSPNQTLRIGAAMIGSVFGLDTEVILTLLQEKIEEEEIESHHVEIPLGEDKQGE